MSNKQNILSNVMLYATSKTLMQLRRRNPILLQSVGSLTSRLAKTGLGDWAQMNDRAEIWRK